MVLWGGRVVRLEVPRLDLLGNFKTRVLCAQDIAKP